jgi:2-hydroxycyclohexanecarboxyl-CoA dehydrogenase
MQQSAQRTCLVIGAGAAGNMGHALALRLAAEGARVVVAGRRAEHLEPLARLLNAAHFLCDISAEAGVASLASRIARELSALDAVIVTAAVTGAHPIQGMTQADIDRIFSANLYGPMFIVKHFAPILKANGSMLFFSSTGALAHMNPPTRVLYNCSKAALERFVQGAAAEYAARGIRINALAPGLVLTPMGNAAVAEFGRELVDRAVARTPLGRLATVSDIAETAAYLVSDRYFDTGQVVQVNGGFSLT